MKKKHINQVSLKNKVLRAFWNITCLLFFRPFGTRFFRRWRLFILSLWGAEVKKSSSVYASSKIWAPWNLKMDENAGIGPNTIIYNQDIISIGKNSKISQYSYLCTAGHDIAEHNNAQTGLIIAPICIEDNVWIGTSSFISLGIRIGQGAVVGACSAVFKDVTAWTVVGGNPAKYIKDRIIKNPKC